MDILNRKLIKADAKEFIGQDRKWLTMGLACLPLMLINSAVSGGFSFVVNFNKEGEVSSTDFSSGSSIITWLLLPFMVGMAGYFLNHLRGNNPDWKSLYREGIDNYGNYLKVTVITEIFITLWTLLLIVPGIIKMLEYFFVNQIMHDNPELDHKQARDLSKRMTDGFKLDLLVMELSFFFWIMLVLLTFGIAYIYVAPYMQCTTAMYYENLKHNAIATGIARPEEFGILPIQEAPVENIYEAPVEASVETPVVSDDEDLIVHINEQIVDPEDEASYEAISLEMIEEISKEIDELPIVEETTDTEE